jgi:hypothetical protein
VRGRPEVRGRGRIRAGDWGSPLDDRRMQAARRSGLLVWPPTPASVGASARMRLAAAGETVAAGSLHDRRGKRDAAAGTWGIWACRFPAQTK